MSGPCRGLRFLQLPIGHCAIEPLVVDVLAHIWAAVKPYIVCHKSKMTTPLSKLYWLLGIPGFFVDSLGRFKHGGLSIYIQLWDFLDVPPPGFPLVFV